MLLLFAALALGLLAGALANWAADVLPGLDGPTETAAGDADAPGPGLPAAGPVNLPAPAAHPLPAAPRGFPRPTGVRCFPLWHYLTLPWYFLTGGTCPHCGAARHWRAPALEAVMALGFGAAALRFAGQPFQLAAAWAYILFLLTVLVIDYEHRLVLNIMSAPGALAAFLLSFGPGMPGPLSALAGGLAGFLLFLVLAVISRGHLGGGDVKLAGVIGLMLGFPAALTALFAGVFLAGLAALVLMAARRAGRKSYMAYAPYLSVGALAVLLRLLGR